MYKQWLCLLLILTLFITLVACGSKEEVDPSVESVIPSSEAVEEKTSIPVTNVPANLLGFCSDTLYTNELLQLQFELPSDWYFYSSSKLAELSGITLGEEEEATQERFITALKATGFTYDMIACENEGTDMVVVSFVHMGYQYGENLSEQQFAEMMLEKYSNRLSGIDSGAADAQISTIYLARDEHPCLQFLSSESGLTLHKTMVFVQAGDFMAVVTAGSPYEGDDVSILDDFTYYEAVSPETTEETIEE